MFPVPAVSMWQLGVAKGNNGRVSMFWHGATHHLRSFATRLSRGGPASFTWVWVKIKPPGIGPQVLVLGSIYQGSILGTDLCPTAMLFWGDLPTSKGKSSHRQPAALPEGRGGRGGKDFMRFRETT